MTVRRLDTSRLGRGNNNMAAMRVQHTDAGQHRPPYMEQRDGVHPGVALDETGPLRRVPGSVHRSEMMQQRTLREPGRTRRVLDLAWLRRIHLWGTPSPGAALGNNLVPLVETGNLAHLRQPGNHLGDHCRHRLTPVRILVDQPHRPRLLEHIGQLPRPIGRIHRHQDQAGQRRAVLEQHPLGTIRRPDGHPFPGLESRCQPPRHRLGLRQDLSICPPSAGHSIRLPIHQPDGVRRSPGYPTQQITDRHLIERSATRRRSIRNRQPRRNSRSIAAHRITPCNILPNIQLVIGLSHSHEFRPGGTAAPRGSVTTAPS